MEERDDKKRAPEEEELMEEVNFEPEEELDDLAAARAKLKKLKDELTKVKGERQEYLDGWQRCKADAVNSRKETLASADRLGMRAKETLLEDLIPALDGFDMAASSPMWESLDAQWTSGIRHIRDQLLDALSRHGVETFGKIGDVFDHTRYDAIEESEDLPGESGTVVRILRSGYTLNGRIVRAAQVVVKK